MPKTLKWFIKRVYQTMGSFTVLNEPYQKVSHTNAKMTQIEFHTNSQENLKNTRNKPLSYVTVMRSFLTCK